MWQKSGCLFILLVFPWSIIPQSVGMSGGISRTGGKSKNLELCRDNLELCRKTCKMGGFGDGYCTDTADCKCSLGLGHQKDKGHGVVLNIFGPKLQIRKQQSQESRYDDKGRGILDVFKPMFFDEDVKTDNVDVDVSVNLTLDMSSLFDMIKTLKAPEGLGLDFECNPCFCLVGCGMHGYTGGFCAKNISMSTSCICTYEDENT